MSQSPDKRASYNRWYQKNKLKIAEQRNLRIALDPEGHKEKRRLIGKRHRELNPERNRLAVKKYKLKPGVKRKEADRRYKSQYGLSIETYESMLEAQGNLCFICKRLERRSYNGTSTKLVVDHNHKTGKIRKLLCHSCNASLGLLEENIDYMKNMIKYVEDHE